MMAGGKGFEPLQTDPESVVLPLDEPPPNVEGNFTTIPSFVQGDGYKTGYYRIKPTERVVLSRLSSRDLFEHLHGVTDSLEHRLAPDDLHALEQRRADPPAGDRHSQNAEHLPGFQP